MLKNLTFLFSFSFFKNNIYECKYQTTYNKKRFSNISFTVYFIVVSSVNAIHPIIPNVNATKCYINILSIAKNTETTVKHQTFVLSSVLLLIKTITASRNPNFIKLTIYCFSDPTPN